MPLIKISSRGRTLELVQRSAASACSTADSTHAERVESNVDTFSVEPLRGGLCSRCFHVCKRHWGRAQRRCFWHVHMEKKTKKNLNPSRGKQCHLLSNLMALFWSSESGLRVLIHGFYIETKTDFQQNCASFSNNPGKWAHVNSVRRFRSYSGLVSPTGKPSDARACIFPINPVQLCLLLLKGVSLP